jgi:DNA-directed RNA polymerase specialized sigma24 family protein
MDSMADLRTPGALDSPDALVPLARAGDQVAFARIVRLHRTDMVRVAYVVTGDEVMALAAVAAAWPLAAGRLGRLRQPGRLGPWLCAIAGREARSAVGRDRDRPVVLEGLMPADPDLADGLSGSSADDRLLLALRDLAGCSPDELAAATGSHSDEVLARLEALEERLDPASRGDLGARLRAYAAIPLPPVDIDAEARRAILVRNDRRIGIASVAVAAIVALLVVSITYIVWDRPAAQPGPVAPTPTVQARPPSVQPGA